VIVRRTRVLHAPVERVWALVEDPYQLSRWWPGTVRVEGVGTGAWTCVLGAERGRTVRADFVLEESEPLRLRRWAQQVEGTPFARLISEAVTDVRLEPSAEGTVVELVLAQRPRGWAILGSHMLRRGARRQLDDALRGLERAVAR
jgi:uncharacterized protein YndB with AHSA1/START domain